MKPPLSIWQKYQAGHATREELAELDAWLQQAGSEALAALWQGETTQGAAMPPEMTARLHGRLQQLSSTGTRIRRMRRAVRWTAAAAVMVAGLGALWFHFQQQRRAGNTGQLAIAWDSITNPTRHARMVTLPDQTRVWLNQQAVLYIRKDYTKNREVRLSGEGYFDVAPDAAHPFRVKAGNIQTLVLGTAFNIDNTPGQAAVYISLVKGSVQVEHATHTAVVLQPGEMVSAGHNGGPIPVSKTGVTDVAAWVKGDLVFNQLPLAEALPKLAAYYGLQIQADPSLLQHNIVTATYHRDEKWQQVLQHLLFIYHLSYRMNDQQQIIIQTAPIR